MKIELRQGDITNQPDIDAIVNAANTELWLGSGVAGAIARRGGPQIEREAVAQGPIRLGEAVATTAGNLPNKFVIHAAAMGYRDEDRVVPKRAGSLSSEAIIRDATANSLSIADKLGCKSIAFPALATGVGGFPVDECARVMIAAVKDSARTNPQSAVRRVVFVLFRSDDFHAFERELKRVERAEQG
jgi:O-acetyl-ADP-ribose deacetylase (regulator of RNase III)